MSAAVSAEKQQQFEHDFAQAMGQVPIANALTQQIQAGFSQGEVQILALRDDGWQQPELFFDTLEDVDLGNPVVTVQGNQLSVRVPATDGWGRGRGRSAWQASDLGDSGWWAGARGHGDYRASADVTAIRLLVLVVDSDGAGRWVNP